jgi:hypothetical protein
MPEISDSILLSSEIHPKIKELYELQQRLGQKYDYFSKYNVKYLSLRGAPPVHFHLDTSAYWIKSYKSDFYADVEFWQAYVLFSLKDKNLISNGNTYEIYYNDQKFWDNLTFNIDGDIDDTWKDVEGEKKKNFDFDTDGVLTKPPTGGKISNKSKKTKKSTKKQRKTRKQKIVNKKK